MSELHTTRLVLMEFRDSDVDPLYEIQGNPDQTEDAQCNYCRRNRFHQHPSPPLVPLPVKILFPMGLAVEPTYPQLYSIAMTTVDREVF